MIAAVKKKILLISILYLWVSTDLDDAGCVSISCFPLISVDLEMCCEATEKFCGLKTSTQLSTGTGMSR